MALQGRERNATTPVVQVPSRGLVPRALACQLVAHMSDPVRFDHYEVLTRTDGALFELGRGAMGVTYKAIDTNLRIPVCLKVIAANHINSEIARQRFVREARSAARLRNA